MELTQILTDRCKKKIWCVCVYIYTMDYYIYVYVYNGLFNHKKENPAIGSDMDGYEDFMLSK